MNPPTPITVDLNNLAQGYQFAQLVYTAERLGVFAAIGNSKKSANELADELAADRRGMCILADALTAIGLLEKDCGTYCNSDQVREQILAGGESKSSQLRMQAGAYEKWGQLYEVIKNGSPVDSMDLTEGLKVDEDLFAVAMEEASFRSAAATAEALDLSTATSVLDIGGGIGAYGVEFLRRNPELKITLLEQPRTIALARRTFQKHGLDRSVNFIAGNVFDVIFEDHYDLVLLSNILHLFPPEKNQELLRKLSMQLVPGGRLIVKEWLLGESRTEPQGTALFSLGMYISNTGQCYSNAEIRAWCEEVGLEYEQELRLATPAQLLIVRKP